jgi:hypothetical protein
MKSDFLRSFRKFVAKIRVSLKSDKNKGTLHEDVCTFMTIFRQILLRMRKASDRSCRENQSSHFIFNNLFSENLAVHEIMRKNSVESRKPQMTI